MFYKGFVLPDDEFLANSFKFIINEKHYDLLPEMNSDDIVMDVGACIGTAVRRVSPQVSKVVAYEPLDFNYEYLLKNIGDLSNVESIQAAVIGGYETERELFLSKHVGAHSLFQRRMHTSVTTIPSVNFHNELERVEPTALIMDIEGGEYELLDDLYNLPSQIRVIAIEIHLGRKNFVINAEELISALEEQNFQWLLKPDPHRDGRFTGSFTNAIGVR